MELNFLQPVHQITVDVNEQSYSTLVVQLTERKKEHISCAAAFVFRRWWIELILLISRYASP